MNVCVTGAAGYVGDAVVQMLLEHGHVVYAYDNLMYGGSYMRQHPNLKFIRGDIRDREKLYSAILQNDAVVHLAALVGDQACALYPMQTEEINEHATRYIADICQKLDKRMVFTSTCSVYGASHDLLDEESPTGPLSLYAGTKLKAEEHVRKVRQHCIFRLGTLFGLSTEHARLRSDLVVNIMTFRAMLGQKLTVFGGEQWRPLLHVQDAAFACVGAIEGDIYGTYILSAQNYTIMNIARCVLDVCDIGEHMLTVTDMKFEDQRNYRVRNQKSLNVGFSYNQTLSCGIRQLRNVIQEGRVADVWAPSLHNAQYIGGLKNV